MAVQLGNAQPAQDYMQIPPAQTAVRGNNATDATTGVDAAASGSEKGRGDRANDFQNLLNSLKKATDGLADETVEKTDPVPDETANSEPDAKTESAEDLAALVSPLIKGMEQLKQLIESMQAELKEGDVRGAIAIAQDAAAKVSRFDPDLILGKDFVDGSLGKKLQDFLAGAAQPAGDTTTNADTEEAPVEEAANTEAEANPAEKLFGMLNSLEMDLLPTRKAEAMPEGVSKAVSEKLAGIADELLKMLEQQDPVLAEKLQNLRQTAEDGLSPEEIESAVALLDESIASLDGKIKKALDEVRSSRNPVAEYDQNKGNEVDLTKTFSTSSDKAAKASTDSRSQRNDQARGVKDFDHDKGAAKNDFAHDLASSLRASLNGAAEEAFDVRPSSATTLGQPGAAYSLDPNDAFGDGITTMLQFLKEEGISEARIVVEPPALGRIDVSLQATASGVEAIFKVDNEHLKQMLQQQLDSLKNSLQAQGIQVSGLTVDIKNRDDHRRQDAQGAKGKVRRLGGIEGAGDEDVEGAKLVRLDLEKGLLHWIA